MTIYQLKKKVKKWQDIKKMVADPYFRHEHPYESAMTFARLNGVDDIAENEEYYVSLLRKAERAANDVIKRG